SFCGNTAMAERVLAAMTQTFPRYTLGVSRAVPVVRASLSLRQGAPRAAIDVLESARRYEASGDFLSQYLRGVAYLQSKSPREAIAEFEKILAHRGEPRYRPFTRWRNSASLERHH